MSVERSFLDCLVKKLAFAKEVEKLGVSTVASQKDTLRQVSQVSKWQNGDIISGKGVTKSGIES
jgi:hypothetical protein